MYYVKEKKWTSLSVLFLLTFLLVLGSGDKGRSEPFILEGLDGDLLLGQNAEEVWGMHWSAPAVSAMNLGFLAEHGFPLFVDDVNGNGRVDHPDLVQLAEILGGEEFMRTDPDFGTVDPMVVYGLAKYVGERYPDRFELKVFGGNFRKEYAEEMGEPLGEELFGVRISVFPQFGFPAYARELRQGEMVWLGLPKGDPPTNHFLAGRSFDDEKNQRGLFPVDLADPKEKPFRPGKATIIQTLMSPKGSLRYGGSFTPADIMISLSPLEKEEPTATGGPDLVCSVDCSIEPRRECVEWSGGSEGGCLDWVCDGYVYRDNCTVPEHNGVCCDGNWRCTEREKGSEAGCVQWETKYYLVCNYIENNIGGAEAGPHTGEIFLDFPVARECLPDKYKRSWWPSLAPGGENKTKIELEISPKCPPEIIECNVDIFQAVEENDEGNNSSQGGIS